MNRSVIINQVSKEEYEKEKIRFRLTPFLEPFWIESFKNDQLEPTYFVFKNENKTMGLAGGLTVKSRHKILWPLSRYLYLYGRPVILGNDAPFVIEEFKRYLNRNGFNRLDIGSFCQLDDYSLKESGFTVKNREEYLVDLRPPLPEIWRKLKKGQKWSVNRAEKKGLIFKGFHDKGKLQDLITCLNETKNQKAIKGYGNYDYFGMPFQTNEVLIRLLNTKNASIAHVSFENRTVSASFVVRNSSYGYYLYAGSTKEGYELNASSYLLWKIIENIKESECEALNLGGLSGDETSSKLAQFKRSFGGKGRLREKGVCDLHKGFRKLLHKYYLRFL